MNPSASKLSGAQFIRWYILDSLRTGGGCWVWDCRIRFDVKNKVVRVNTIDRSINDKCELKCHPARLEIYIRCMIQAY